MPKTLKTVSMVLLWIFIITAFGILSTCLIFMALGYKYNFHSGEVQKTGMIYLKALPKTADVYVDKELKALKTPARIPYLSQRSYQVEISEPKYITWQKNIEIKSEEVASFDRIVLFLKDRTLQKLQTDAAEILASPNHNRIAFLTRDKKELKVLSANSDRTLSLYKGKNPLSLVSWSENSGRILFKENKKGYFAVSATNPKTIFDVGRQFDYTFTQVEWNPDNYNFLFALSDKNALFRLDIVNNRIKVLKSRVQQFDVSNNEIFYISKSSNNEKLLKANFQGNGSQVLMDNISPSASQIAVSASGRVALKYSDGKLVYLIKDGSVYKPETLKDAAAGFSWTSPVTFLENLMGKDKLLYFSENEIGGYYKKRDPRYTEEENHLITRVSSKIDKAEWYYDLEHVVYLSEGRVHVVELDGGNDTILAENVKDFATDADGKTLYLLTSSGLNEMMIR